MNDSLLSVNSIMNMAISPVIVRKNQMKWQKNQSQISGFNLQIKLKNKDGNAGYGTKPVGNKSAEVGSSKLVKI